MISNIIVEALLINLTRIHLMRELLLRIMTLWRNIISYYILPLEGLGVCPLLCRVFYQSLVDTDLHVGRWIRLLFFYLWCILRVHLLLILHMCLITLVNATKTGFLSVWKIFLILNGMVICVVIFVGNRYSETILIHIIWGWYILQWTLVWEIFILIFFFPIEVWWRIIITI